MKKITLDAKAKINLFLEVTGKRENGYHDIESIMMQIPLSDTVTLQKTKNTGVTEIASESTECARVSDFCALDPKENLCYKAAELFMSKLYRSREKETGIKITVKKRIPVKGGMAGGSADAAAVFKGLNLLFGEPFSTDELCDISSSLGADIPFCIRGGVTLCSGIGEIMTPIRTTVPLHGIVTLEKDEKLSTGAAYSKVDALTNREIKSADKIVSALEKGSAEDVARECFNIFGVACGYDDGGARILLENGALNATLSGAGPSVFGLFDNSEAIKKSKKALTLAGYPVFEF
ncbi:MAG: 4-(cytidine 5'-diphospho)-2-C-methyl-D-erythritol kinase [Ruminococcaceae bacterium]|nr:4-(cytidine 5'-diphospho)-2-C-methyl-D-erythritol kinase [Oscillospiraceae bacterium]